MKRISIVVCAYNMQRELPRTIYSLSRSYQHGLEDLDYEIVILDNGSKEPVDEVLLQQIAPNLRVHRVSNPSRSPVAAINALVGDLDCDLVGLWIDGARMASPGLISQALGACGREPSKIVGTIAFHLGPDVQMRSMLAGYNQQVEDSILAQISWKTNGYGLFDASVLALSSKAGWFGCIAESNAVFFGKVFWNRLGGFDERFQESGGGFANLDFWKRAVAASDNAPVIILGEATFHQIHGGAATNGSEAVRERMAEEYAAIHGHSYEPPVYMPLFVGELDERRLKVGSPAEESGRMVHSVRGRPFPVDVPAHLLETIQQGTLRTQYKGFRFCKNPFDMALYLRLLQRLRPKTIIEIGVSEGGSSVWFYDQCRALGLDTNFIGIDIGQPRTLPNSYEFFIGNSEEPDYTFPKYSIEKSAHPWLIIEDSAHTYRSVRETLSFFKKRMISGDYIVVEDGTVADLPGERYRAYEDGPNRAVAEFLQNSEGDFTIDTDICDFYGRNVTYCPNAWIRKG